MTRRAHNVDRERTECAGFIDKRSYWTNTGHMYVFGEDASDVGAIICMRDEGICQSCGQYCRRDGELDHIKGGNTDDRCWCSHNLQWICRTCHRGKHVRPQFGVKVSA